MQADRGGCRLSPETLYSATWNPDFRGSALLRLLKATDAGFSAAWLLLMNWGKELSCILEPNRIDWI